MTQNIIWKFERSYDFYKDLAMRESSNDHTLDYNTKIPKKKTGHIGLYQFGEQALVDAKYYRKPPKPNQKDGAQYNNDWGGLWTGKNGIHSREDFLNSREVQEIAVREYHKIIWEEKGYLGKYNHYEGASFGGITLTKSGMIAASHLLGSGEVVSFIKSGGTKEIPQDGLNTTLTEYLIGFADARYEVNYNKEAPQSKHDLRKMGMLAPGLSQEEKLDAIKFAEALAEQAEEITASSEYDDQRREAQEIIAALNAKTLSEEEAKEIADLCAGMETAAAAFAQTDEGRETIAWANQLKADSALAAQSFLEDPTNRDFLLALGIVPNESAKSST